MKINNNEIKAVIFDLDGTLLDSTNIWKEVDRDFFASHNMEVPSDYGVKIAHMGLKDCASFTKKEYGFKEDEEDIIETWLAMAAYKYANTVKLNPNAKEYLDYLKKNNIRLAVATANSEALYLPCLKALEIIDYFEVLADVEKVNSGKNTPKIFEYVEEKMNLKAKEMVVIDDMAVCLKVAKDAGFNTIAILTDDEKQNAIKKEVADMSIEGFGELL